MLPVPDRGLGNADDVGDFSLEEAKIHSPFADVIADGVGIGGVAGEGLFIKGKIDCERVPF